MIRIKNEISEIIFIVENMGILIPFAAIKQNVWCSIRIGPTQDRAQSLLRNQTVVHLKPSWLTLSRTVARVRSYFARVVTRTGRPTIVIYDCI